MIINIILIVIIFTIVWDTGDAFLLLQKIIFNLSVFCHSFHQIILIIMWITIIIKIFNVTLIVINFIIIVFTIESLWVPPVISIVLSLP